ncbi:putative PEP-CTERM system TPR-repeat lipoprotein [Legionella massiliensis]|uniref:Putative PEP-CTERM system TPR-repeat lipoprotein n=1 Tax=Legionella massiliensis TaxID=1034943 RepID=A0A078KZG5_9GAMM|nr:tetratricopeptide repeat protein [Legionella massiliensis]CDZ78311.1 putative PEP-CTERM system TPR-repeat lipoprotein [Legionella massiliensis]CEE14049.1 Bacterial transcriptional activator domain protein [Legionella massiliensis]
MAKRSKIIIAVSISALVIGFLIFIAHKQTFSLQRDPTVLMNKYYLFKQDNPAAAKKALQIILQQDENYFPALKELTDIYLKEKNNRDALPLLERLHQLQPENNQYAGQLAYTYYELGNWDKALQLFTELKKQQKGTKLKIDAQLMINSMASYIPSYINYAYREIAQPKIEFKESTVLQILLDLYYKTRDNEADKANELLAVLHLLSPNKPLINEEIGYLALQKKDTNTAIFYLSLAFNEEPSDKLALQLGYLYALEKKNEDAASYFLLASMSKDKELRQKALKSYEIVSYKPTLQPQNQAQAMQATRESLMLDQYYLLKKTNKQAAWVLIKQIIREYPNNVQALKEGGFLAIEEKSTADAIDFFKRAYELTYQADLAMQLGYLYGEVRDNYRAYQYFKFATKTQDKELELRAQNAMTNLAGVQTKFLPAPYFSELFFTPFKQSRFGLTVRPLIARLGIELNDRFQTKSYIAFRQTDDNKTLNLGQIPQIYEDNVRIISIGLQVTPFKKIPLVGFVEAGGAYDLVFRNRTRWRGDLRGGFMYYNELGARPAYYDKLTLGAKYYCTLYADTSYFSRFRNNVITTLKTNQGIRLLQYHSSMLNFYMTGRTLFDTNRDFFNNIAEVGPGFSIQPSNRFNALIRFEAIKGMYLPVGNSTNPYGKYYTNRTVQLLLYVKM